MTTLTMERIRYTASAFGLSNLEKTVVLTGSQLPWCDVRTDARQDSMLALVIAANYEIPEVCIRFTRGNRSVKADSHSRCPNVKPLGVYDLKPRIDWNLISIHETKKCRTLVVRARVFPNKR